MQQSMSAVGIKLDLGPDATRADVLKAIDGHILAKGVVSGHFVDAQKYAY
jgi:hypothetical protein